MRLTGDFQIVSEPDLRVVHLKNKKARSLLAYVAMQPELSAPRGTLANLLWPDCMDTNARHSLRQCLVGLRKELDEISPGLLRVDNETVSLDADRVEADAARLLLVDNATPRAELNAILKSIRGEFLPELQVNDNFSNWASDLRRRVNQKLEEILITLDRDPITDEATASAVVAARMLTQAEPFCEDCRRLLIRLTARVYGAGRAVAEYKSFVDFLRRDGAGAPEALTRDLIEQIQSRSASTAPQVAIPQVDAMAATRIEADPSGKAASLDEATFPATDHKAPAHEPTAAAPVQPHPKFRWVEFAYRMAAAAALFFIVTLLFQNVDQFTHIDQAEATSLSTLMAGAQDDPLVRTIPVAVRPLHGLANDDPLNEQLREAISDILSKIPVVNLLASADSASARYVLSGKIKNEFGFPTLIIDLSQSNGDRLWREKFSLGENAALSRELANRIGREVDLALVKAEANSAITRNDVSARSLLLSARAINLRGVSSRSGPESLRLYEKALSLDDDSASALAGISGQIITSQSHGLRMDAELQQRADQYLRRAISIDPNQPLAHFHMGMLHKIRGQASQAILSFNRVLELNPSFAPAYANLGHALLLQGRMDEALDNVRYAMRISPNDGYFANWSLFAGEIEFERGNIDVAIDWFRAAIARGPHLTRPYGWIAAAYEAAGDHAAAADNIRQFRSLLGETTTDQLMNRLQKVEGGLYSSRPKLYRAVALAAQRYL